MRSSVPWFALFLLGLAIFNNLSAAENFAPSDWPRWRGVDGRGITDDTKLPETWDASHIVWKTELPGSGQSSPVVVGDRVFLTSAVDKGGERLVFCVNRKTGKLEWTKSAWKGTPEATHNMNGWASSTCASDGERVYAAFGWGGVHCYTVDGQHVWSKELGKFESKTKRGTAASPVVVDNLVIWNGDSESDPFLFGLNKLTGDTVWKVPRAGREGYSTPVLVTAAGRRELVLNGDPAINGYDPLTGKLLWSCKCFAGRGEPTPAVGKDALFVVNGQPGDVFAVRPGGDGDVTKSHITWHTPRKAGRDQPSPALAGKWLLVSSLAGVLSCYDAESGQEVWKDRLPFGNISASPFVAGDKVYFLGEDGQTAVLQAGPEFKLVAMNKLNPVQLEVFRASPTPCAGQILIRSDRNLYCVGKGKS